MNPPIIVKFKSSNLGRIEFEADVIKNGFRSHGAVSFKLDLGSDFTTISCMDLRRLGYTDEVLQKCPKYETKDGKIPTMADGTKIDFRFIRNVSIKFIDREIQNCRLFFAIGTGLRSLFGCDILKYFNIAIDYDAEKVTLTQRESKPLLSDGEEQIHIYSVEAH